MKNILFQCLCTYIRVSGLPSNPPTLKWDNPVIFFFFPAQVRKLQKTSRLDTTPLLTSKGELIRIILTPSSESPTHNICEKYLHKVVVHHFSSQVPDLLALCRSVLSTRTALSAAQSSTHQPSASENRRAQWIEYDFDVAIPATICKTCLCANYFLIDCFTNLSQYKTGLATKL